MMKPNPTALSPCLVLVLLTMTSFAGDLYAQQVRLVGQHGNLQTLAGSQCPNDPPAGADLGKFFSYDLIPYDEQVGSSMDSGCGAASSTSEGMSRRSLDHLDMELSTEATLDRYGAASAHAQIQFTFEIEETTSYEITIRGRSENTSEAGSNDGQVFLIPSVGDPVHSVLSSPLLLDERWEGELEPGRYTLVGFCLSGRMHRQIGELDIFEDGVGRADLSVTILFSGAVIVPTADLSVGELKARYGSKD